MAAQPPPEQPLEPASDSDPWWGLGGRLPLLLPPGPARQWLQTRRLGVRPWGSFLDPQRFGAPRGLADVGQRLRRNGAHFQSNYLCVGLGIGLYGLISSPGLVAALGVFLGVWYRLRMRQKGALLMGYELPPPPAVAALVSLPLFWFFGAGAAVCWGLGASLLLIGAHAALRLPEPPPEGPPLQMEPV
ncbi:prenylated Rab acceptor protein 1-like [Caloenas nicobarica]|uniref:prenylated Rab acceptor protein 1-like n=1 Tax=Caloenas nicobarica TaxID=187106 RepID=UPI0032B80FCC